MVEDSIYVSCVVCTKDRPQHIARAVAQYDRQTVEERELVVVDSGEKEVPPEVREYVEGNGQYIRVRPGMPLGDALNEGFAKARGYYIQKWDDDDLYQPGFLERGYRALYESGAPMVMWGRFLVVVGGITRLAENGILAGGTILLRRPAWIVAPFREGLRARVDAALMEDLGREFPGEGWELVIDSPALYTWVRHGGNMSQRVVSLWGGERVEVDMDTLLARLPEWRPK